MDILRNVSLIHRLYVLAQCIGMNSQILSEGRRCCRVHPWHASRKPILHTLPWKQDNRTSNAARSASSSSLQLLTWLQSIMLEARLSKYTSSTLAERTYSPSKISPTSFHVLISKDRGYKHTHHARGNPTTCLLQTKSHVVVWIHISDSCRGVLSFRKEG